jgi:predicted RNase H-like HicB family nuclease
MQNLLPSPDQIEFDREADGRWIAEVADLSGVLVYGDSREDAMLKATALAREVEGMRTREQQVGGPFPDGSE